MYLIFDNIPIFKSPLYYWSYSVIENIFKFKFILKKQRFFTFDHFPKFIYNYVCVSVRNVNENKMDAENNEIIKHFMNYGRIIIFYYFITITYYMKYFLISGILVSYFQQNKLNILTSIWNVFQSHKCGSSVPRTEGASVMKR
jgi:hypothetical protein